MVKTGGPLDTEYKWSKLTKEQVKGLDSEISLEVNKIIEEIESKLQLLADKPSTDDWYTLVARLGKRLKAVIDCFPPYSAASYEPLKKIQHKNILQELKEYNKKKVYLDQYFKVKGEIIALEESIAELKEAQRRKEESKEEAAQHMKKLASNRAFLREIKASIKRVTNEIVDERKEMERVIATLKSQKTNAIQRLNDLRATSRQKATLLKEQTEQKEREEASLQWEYRENNELVRNLACSIRAQKVLQAEVNCQSHNIRRQ